jgi:uncharacterized protein DUF4926
LQHSRFGQADRRSVSDDFQFFLVLTGNLLRRGIGAVVMTYADGAREVEFADRDGRAFAILPLRPDQLMVLHNTSDSRRHRQTPPASTMTQRWP